MADKLIYAPATTKATTPPVESVRAFVFLSGMRWLREHGHVDRFFELLPADVRELAGTLAATDWVSLETALACYAACDALELSVAEQIDLGRVVSDANNVVFVRTIVRLIGRLGASPWAGLRHADNVWRRSNKGGAVAVFEEGANSARLEYWQVPLAQSRFFMTSMRGAVAAGIEPFCKRLVVSEIPDQTSSTGFALRLTWL